MSMRVLLAILLFSVVSVAALADQRTAALKSADAWAAAVDAEQYEKAWDMSGPLLQKSMSQDSWSNHMRATHKRVGRAIKRRFIKATYRSEEPAKGCFLVEYACEFEKGGPGTETIYPRQDPDGRWRVCGWLLKLDKDR